MKIPNLFKSKVEPIPQVEHDNHQHQWELAAKTYAPPVKRTGNPYNTNNPNEALASERMQFGVTVLLFQCAMCKNFVKEEMLGSDGNTLDDMLSKAELYGPQVVQKPSGETYIIQKYTQSQGDALPVR